MAFQQADAQSAKTTELEMEEEYYDEEESEIEDATELELQRLQALVESNKTIPEVIILKDENGVPQEYEVLVES